MNRVEGKAALITGGGAGIGAATGELICAEGGMALLVDADARALAGTMQAIAERVPRARVSTFAADVADANAAARAVEHALQTFGPPLLPLHGDVVLERDLAGPGLGPGMHYASGRE